MFSFTLSNTTIVSYSEKPKMVRNAVTVAGVTYVMGVPGADDVMLAYQSTSFHDGLYARAALGRRPAPEFEAWMERMGIARASGEGQLPAGLAPALVGLQ